MKGLRLLIVLLCHLPSTWMMPQQLEANQELDMNGIYLDRLLLNVNTSVNPCDDFYGYACGNWSNNYIDTDIYLDMPGYMDYFYNKQLLSALEEKHSDGGIFAQLWAYYNSCLSLKQPSLNEMLHLVEDELDFEWPIFRINQSEPWANETHFDWLGTLARLRVYGLNGIFLRQEVNVRRENGSHYVLHLMQQQPVAVKSQLAEQQVLDLYIAFGLNKTLAQNRTGRLLQLEWQVGNLTNMYPENGNESIGSELPEWTLKQLTEKLPQLDWRYYFSTLLARPLPDKQLIQVVQLEESYLDRLQVILDKSSNETLAYYIMFKLLYYFNEELPLAGKDQDSSIACIHQLRGHMPLAMNYLYEQSNYAARRDVYDAALQQMMANIQEQFDKLLQENRLHLNSEEMSYVREELGTLSLKIGNIPHQLTEKQVGQYYKDLHLHPLRFFSNKLQLLKMNSQLVQQMLLNLPQHEGYYHQEASVSQNSSPVKIFQNAIVLPYGYLQLPIYDVRIDKLMQYSQFGFILAHELQHAFDLFHIVYDARGNYNETGLGLVQHFLEFINCYAKSPSDHVLLSETMSDIVGLRLTFAAYFDQIKPTAATRTEENPHLSHSRGNYTDEQLFFLNSVQFLCGNMQKIEAMAYSGDAEHGLHNKRVNRNWAHHEHFARTFHCSPGQTMHKEEICRLW
ncbi:uncharacterized protein Dwil_GK12098 [Drosophila willistoni]|uniref:Uncharacterized protein n=1 Tax=Drosophila willistoni TaxID=7260 RepID=B4N8P5_DROWI|nr:neprilysin-2 [Drosophila willistoni]EDW81496.1 uncharacterized protein Dwil_GK12098 [Drosophila willistoni]